MQPTRLSGMTGATRRMSCGAQRRHHRGSCAAERAVPGPSCETLLGVALHCLLQRVSDDTRTRVFIDPSLHAVIRLTPSERFFAPLLELQATQHRAMFSRVTMRASLIMCSHVATALREPRGGIFSVISTPQYTHDLSRSIASCSSQSGMRHSFIAFPVTPSARVDRPRRANTSQRSGRTRCWAARRHSRI